MPEYKLLPIEQLREPANPIRVSMDEAALMSLADSIKQVGLLEPIIVVPILPGQASRGPTSDHSIKESAPAPSPAYEIIAGHRRYKACIIADLNAAPCLVFHDAEIARHAAMLAENIEREDITPAEEAIFFAELIDKYDYTEEQLLTTVKKSAGYVYARLDLLKGNQAVFHALREKKINMAVATQLNRCDDAAHCEYLLSLAVQGGATAATVAKWVSEWRGASPTTQTAGVETANRPVQSTTPAPDDRRCFVCRLTEAPLNMVPMWVHDYCQRNYERALESAASPEAPSSAAAQGA